MGYGVRQHKLQIETTNERGVEMEIIWFTLVGIGVYLIANGILVRIEQRRGSPLPNRSVVFFVIFLVLALSSFELIQYLAQPTN